MATLQMWWQAADKPFHCRPDDPCYSALFPEPGGAPFVLRARPGLTAPMQLMLRAGEDARVTSITIDTPWITRIPALRGTDRFGGPFVADVALEADKPWPIWVLLEIPLPAEGAYRFGCTVRFADDGAREIPLDVYVSGDRVHHGGEDDLHTLARLAWLDSTAGCEDTLTGPYTPLAVNGSTISLLGREVTLADSGLPERLITHFTGINDALSDAGEDIFALPPRLEAVLDGQPVRLTGACRIVSRADTRVAWEAPLACGALSCAVRGFLEFDGWMRFDVRWETMADTLLDDIRLVFFPKQKYARWFSGVGTMARENLDHHRWQWDRQKHQDAFFCGGMNGGIVCRPVAEDYVRPYCNIYYKFGPRNQPEAWVNGGAGFFALERKDAHTALGYHTGPIRLRTGEARHTNFDLGFTPFKRVDPAAHYAVRYYQAPGETEPAEWIATAKEIGATHINVHHGKEIYPYINYPMYDAPAMRDFARGAHAAGLKVKPYYTVRELTSKLPEFFPLRSLRGEIFAQPDFHFDGVPGQGEKDPWLAEECGDRVLPAWKAVFTRGKYAGECDPSVIVNPASRIINFYIEGLRWMCDAWGIDGVYIDDTGMDRHALQRARRVLDGCRPGAKIDLHSWNHFHDLWGEAFGHNAVMYAELFPYVDSLWFGEGFDFDEMSPEEMLVECSGLPFGLMSEMLEGGGNPWRGLLFGMTGRAGWSREKDPRGVWALREKYGLNRAKLRGWWEENPAARAGDSRVLVTVYDLPGGAMLCAASFAEAPLAVSFALTGGPFVSAHLPEVALLQEGRPARVGETHCIEPGQGIVIFYERGIRE